MSDDVATPDAPWRLWPRTLSERIVLCVAAGAVLAFMIVLMALRYRGMFGEFSADGDQPQAVWHYWRYRVAGAFPPGDLMTDYAYVMHAPPVWWALMASLSTFMSPLVAAKVLNIVAWLLTAAALWVGVARRSNGFVGLAAVLLLVRNVDFTAIIAGGYARSFGPFLTLTFLAAFMAPSSRAKHYACLAILVLQAAFYPSVVIPCGLAYGAYCVIAGPMRDRVRRCAGMFVAGLLIIAFGEFQEIKAPAWWGSVVTLDEALQMPAWKAGGRISEAPLRPVVLEVERNAERAFRLVGHVPFPKLTNLFVFHEHVVSYAVVLVALAALVALVVVRRRRALPAIDDPFPWQIPALFVAALLAYFLARQLAFKLYLPYRPLQHVWAYMFYAGLPLLAWSLVVNLLPRGLRRRHLIATAVTCVSVVGSTYFLYGDGWERGPKTYGTYENSRKIYTFIQSLPVDAVFAGEVAYVDKIPLFTWHKSYVTKNLAHPFRQGYYAECERRIRAMYNALYATDPNEILQFAKTEKVDYFVVRKSLFTASDPRLFQPVKRDIDKLFREHRAAGFALANPPPSSIVFSDQGSYIVSVSKLATAVADSEKGDLSGPQPQEDGKPDTTDDDNDPSTEATP